MQIVYPQVKLLSLCDPKIISRSFCFLLWKEKLWTKIFVVFCATTTKQLPTDQSTQRGARPVRWRVLFFWTPGPSGWWRVQTVGSCCRHTTITPGVARGMGVESAISWEGTTVVGNFLLVWFDDFVPPCLVCLKSCFTELPEKMDDKWWDVWDEIRIIQGFKLLIPSDRQIVCFKRSVFKQYVWTKKILHDFWVRRDSGVEKSSSCFTTRGFWPGKGD